jgi:uncharacterized protein
MVGVMRTLLVCGWVFLTTLTASAADAHVREIERWRTERVAKLTAPDGWLTLVGLHFLKEGPNTIGNAKDNDVVLAKGPARLGTVTVAANGKVMLEVAPNTDVHVDGQATRRAELKWDVPAKPTLVTSGTITFFAIDRAGKKALRVKDSESPARVKFAGLDYFPIDPMWRVEARWEPFGKLRMIPVVNILGQTEMNLVAGKAVFERDGKKIELTAIDEGPEAPLFFVISDATSGKETYGGGRHLYVARPKEGARTIVLDFNRAENPPCAFTRFSTCPVPPRENRLPFAVRAGEKTYRGGVD